MTSSFPENREPPVAGFSRWMADVWRGARAGWSPRCVLALFVAVAPVYLCELWWWRGAAAFEGWGLALTVALALAFIALGGLTAGVVAAASGWEYGRDYRATLGETVRHVRDHAAALAAALLYTPLLVLGMFAIIAGGAWAFAHVAPALAIAWLVVAGTPFALVAVVFLFLAAPASVFMVPAAVLDCHEAFEVVCKAISFVRARPLKAFVGTLAALLGASVVAALVALVVALVIGFLTLAHGLGAERAGLGDALRGWQLEVEAADLLWPLPVATLDSIHAGLADARRESGLAKVAVGGRADYLPGLPARLVAASFLAALVGGLTRLYLLLRHDIEREPPSSLVLTGERFGWARDA